MSLFFSHAPRPRYILILDIQSGLVRGALAEKTPEGGTIREVVTQSLPEILTPADSQRMFKKVLKLVSDVAEHLSYAASGHTISEAHYIFSSPWIFPSLKTLKTDFPHETEITHSLVEKSVADEVRALAPSAEATLIEGKVFETRLNGYSVPSYEGKKAHSLQVSLGISYCPKGLPDKFRGAVEKTLDIRSHIYHSALFMQYAGLRTLLTDRNEYVYIHTHSELTDIIIVKNGLCRHISSFPFGTATLLRKMAHSLKQGIPACDSLLTLYQGNKLSEVEKKRVHRAIEPLLDAWFKMCMKSLNSSFDNISVPRTVLISAHSHFELLKEALMLENDLNLEVIPYEQALGRGRVTFEKGAPRSELMEIYMLALHSVVQ